MQRFSLTSLSIMVAGLLQLAPGLATDVLASNSVIWIEPVARDYGQAWKKKTAASPNAGDRISSDHENRERAEPSHEPAANLQNRDAKKADNRGGMGHGRTRLRKATVHAGAFPQSNANPSGPALLLTQFWLELPDNSLMPVKLKKSRGRHLLTYPYTTGGDYRLIGYHGNQVQGDARLHFYSYYCFMAHGDKPDKQPRDSSSRPGFHNGRPMLEIIRFYDSERIRYRSRAGHRLHVRVLYKGKPVVNAPVILTTSNSWQKRIETDDRGEASFTLIKEDFQHGFLDKHKSTLFMLQTEHSESSPGVSSGSPFAQEKYIATLSFQVFPDSNEWESKHIAFLIVIFTIVVVGTAIVIHRTHRRPKT
jgi:hypothetical protein